MSNPRISLTPEVHHAYPVVILVFDKDEALINKLKTIKGATWSQSRKFWWIPQEEIALMLKTKKNINALLQLFIRVDCDEARQ